MRQGGPKAVAALRAVTERVNGGGPYEEKSYLPSAGIWVIIWSTVFGKAALVGEPAVPCNLQSATAGMNSRLRESDVSTDFGKWR